MKGAHKSGETSILRSERHSENTESLFSSDQEGGHPSEGQSSLDVLERLD